MRLKAILFAAAMVPTTAFAQYGAKHETTQQPGQEQGQQGKQAEELQTTQDSQHGLTVVALNPVLRKSLSVPSDAGVLVLKVAPDSPAQKAGIKAGDVITKLGDEPVKSGADLTSIQPTGKGEKQAAHLIRDKKPMTVQLATAEKTPETQMPSEQNMPPDENAPSGQNAPPARNPSSSSNDKQRTPSGMPWPA